MLKKLFIKYIIGECRHLCCMCKYRNECNVNYEEVSWKMLLTRYKYRKTIKRITK